MLQAGTVKSLPAGNLVCFSLFRCVSPIFEEEDIHENIIEDNIFIYLLFIVRPIKNYNLLKQIS